MLASAGDDPGLALPRASSLGDAPREARRGDPPLDRAAYWLCFHLGVGILLPWNAYVTAVDYFAAIHPNAHVDRLFGVLYFLPNLSTLPFVLRFAHLAAPRLRVRFGFGVFLACLLVPAAAPRSLAALCAAVALTGVADAFAQGSLFGVVAQMPPAYTQALMGGTSFSGVVVSALRLVAKAAAASDSVAGLRHGAVAYFAVAATWVASCLVAHGALERTEAYARNAAGEREGFRASDASEEYESERAALRDVDGFSFSSSASAADRDPGNPAGASRGSVVARKRSATTLGDAYRVARDVRFFAASVTACYAVTLSIFPGFLAEDVASATFGDWYPVLLIAAFNVADLVGKTLPGLRPGVFAETLAGRPGTTLALCLSRVLFVPAFDSARRGGAASGETATFALTAALGATNGWYSTAAMMAGPRWAAEEDAEACGTVMVFFLLVGLALGAMCGWLWLL